MKTYVEVKLSIQTASLVRVEGDDFSCDQTGNLRVTRGDEIVFISPAGSWAYARLVKK